MPQDISLGSLLPLSSASRKVNPFKRLTSKCRDNLRAIHFKVHQIDVLAATEICAFSTVFQMMGSETVPEKRLFPKDDYTSLVAASTHMLHNDYDFDIRDLEVLGELTKTQNEKLERLRSVSRALIGIQTGPIYNGNESGEHTNFLYVEYSRNVAERFLHLANDVTLLLSAVVEEVQAFDQRIVLAISYRLSILLEFSPLWKRLTAAEERNQSIRNMSRGSHPFQNNFDSLSRKLAQSDAPGLEYNNTLHRWDPTLTAASMIVIVSCVVVLALAWRHSPSSPGTVQDSGFYFLIQGAMMQALGIFTVMLPLGRRAPYQAWKWAWTFAVFGTMSLLASIILYSLVQTWWSGLCTFLAAASQAAITLQVMLTVDSTWKRASKKGKQS